MNSKHTRRWIETDKRIWLTTMELADHCGLEHLTIRAICEKAEINRTTFYEHFRDLQDLFDKVEKNLRKNTWDQLKQVASGFSDLSADSLIPFLNHIRENKNFFRFFLKIKTSNPMKDYFFWFLSEETAPFWQGVDLTDNSRFLYSIAFFHAGFTTVLCRWVENGCLESTEEIAEIIINCLPDSGELSAMFKAETDNLR